MYTKSGTRKKTLICRPHSLLELPDLRDSSKLCGLQNGIVEVVAKKNILFVFRAKMPKKWASDLSASQRLFPQLQ
tara:strand:+ start:97 stop:321 length:225 start_codon:yes stop_codon:yes gene_type:complete